MKKTLQYTLIAILLMGLLQSVFGQLLQPHSVYYGTKFTYNGRLPEYETHFQINVYEDCIWLVMTDSLGAVDKVLRLKKCEPVNRLTEHCVYLEFENTQYEGRYDIWFTAQTIEVRRKKTKDSDPEIHFVYYKATATIVNTDGTITKIKY